MVTNKFITEPYLLDPKLVKFSTKFSQFNAPKSDEEYESLLMQIKDNGQIDPILIRNGEVDDGVHRVKVARELKRKVLAIDVDPSISDKEYILMCNKNTFAARNDSSTQKAIKGYMLVTEFDYTDTEAAKVIGLKDRRMISYVRAVKDSKQNKTDNILDTLLAGNRVTIGDNRPTKSVEVVRKQITLIEEAELRDDKEVEEKELTIDYNDMLETETARVEFWKLERTLGSIETKLSVISLLNYRYALPNKGNNDTSTRLG